MTARNSALKALGLRTGAGRAEIDEAYRRLIKLHHPDRTGGDAGRAAEINHAYALLRREVIPALRRARQVTVPPPIRSPRQARRSGIFPTILIFALLCGAIVVGATMTERNFNRHVTSVRWPLLASAPATGNGAVPPVGSFDDPLNADVIENAIEDAVSFRAIKDDDDAIAYSRNCQANLRADPSLAWFDACAAFDEAMATLRDEDSGLDSGPFSDSELMTRELSAARALSDDSLGADARLHQIRSKVQIRLLPSLDAAAGVKP